MQTRQGLEMLHYYMRLCKCAKKYNPQKWQLNITSIVGMYVYLNIIQVCNLKCP